MAQTKCSGCGTPSDGEFCTRCGKPINAIGHCSSCGSACEVGALYCRDCGAPVGKPPVKSMRARLPWILTGLALVAFAIALSVMIGKGTGERAPGMPPTGSIITGAQPATGPSGVDLSSMTPREAADRLFDRAMREESAGNMAQALQFAEMGVRTYGMIPAAEVDADAHFHLGLLELLRSQPDDAELHANAILETLPDHLLGWVLQERISEQRGDATGVEQAQSRFLAVLDAQRALNLAEYAQHAVIIDGQEARLRSAQ